MIYISLPVTSQIGWGICGRYISQELARIADVRLLTGDTSAAFVNDELDLDALTKLLPKPAELSGLPKSPLDRLDGPLLTAAAGFGLQPSPMGLRGTKTVGYTFFEYNRLKQSDLEEARSFFDHIVAGSAACEMRLRDAGLTEVSTIIQGIDPAVFEPSPVDRLYLRDRFVIFSGGKLELRKGQDVVVRAFKALQEKFNDLVLMTAWHNAFGPSLQAMASSSLVRFSPQSTAPVPLVREFLAQNDIDLRRVIVLAPKPNFIMSRFYKQTDVGIFPSRCEGGTNLVLMEYMACGKPAIATFSSGHCDVMTRDNSIPLRNLKPVDLELQGEKVAVWDEPDVDEVIAAIEYAYHNRDQLHLLGRQAGTDLKRHTWSRTATQFKSLFDKLN